MDLRKVIKPAVEDLENTALWDRVAVVIAGIVKEDEALAAEEEDGEEELEGYINKTKVLKDIRRTSNTINRPNIKHQTHETYQQHTDAAAYG